MSTGEVLGALIGCVVGAMGGVAWAAWRIGAFGETLRGIAASLKEIRGDVHQLYELHSETGKLCASRGAELARHDVQVSNHERRLGKTEEIVAGLQGERT